MKRNKGRMKSSRSAEEKSRKTGRVDEEKHEGKGRMKRSRREEEDE